MSTSTRPLIVGPDVVKSPYPIRVKGPVSKGFGRGSKELGIPTANLPEEAASSLGLETGIYYGFASVGSNQTTWPMVMSYGWNPFYKNEKRSAEIHIIHKFDNDFYDEELRVIILGYVRPELDYAGVEALIADINWDIKAALESLKRQNYKQYRNDSFLTTLPGNKM